MKVFYGIENYCSTGDAVVTVGSFDGVHSGHAVLLGRTVEAARRLGCDSVALTFGNHPRNTISQSDHIGILTSVDEKNLLLSQIGLDAVVYVPFDEYLRNLSAEDFVRQIIVGRLHARHIIIGYNHHFGKDKLGNKQLLDTLAAELGYRVEEVGEMLSEGHHLSSTQVRHFIAAGDIARANELLGHPYIVMGEIRQGRMQLDNSKMLPPNGTYNVGICIDGQKRAARVEVVNSIDSKALIFDEPLNASAVVNFC